MENNSAPIIAALFVIATICQWIAWRVRVPAILFLLLAGMAIGPIFGGLEPDVILGDLLFPFISLSVAIILFEGSLTLNYKEIRFMQNVVRNILSIGMLTTWMIITFASKVIFDLDWEISFLFGAIMVVTGPTVIAPIIKTVRPNASISNILKWESIVIDPIGASLAVLVYEFIISGGGQKAIGHTMLTFGQILLVGLIIGCLAGYVFGLLLRYHHIPEFLHNITTLGLVFGTFAVSNMLQHEAGLVTVTVFGIWLANMRGVDLTRILEFKETLSTLLISLLFIILAARVDFESLRELGFGILLLLFVVQFLARPASIMFSTIGSPLKWPERHFLAWIAPRGIVAAAVAALFAFKLENYGHPNADILISLTFIVIIGTVIIQSTTAAFIARLLGVSEPEPEGIFIVGANPLSVQISIALKRLGLNVLVAGQSEADIQTLKQAGVDTFLGNPTSELANRYLHLGKYRTMLTLSQVPSMNTAASLHFRMEFERKNVYRIRERNELHQLRHIKDMEFGQRGQKLFPPDVSYATLIGILINGGHIRTVQLTHSKSYQQLLETHEDKNIIPLFGIDPKKQLYCLSCYQEITPTTGWDVIFATHN